MQDTDDPMPDRGADDPSPLGAVPIEITVSVGKTRPVVRDLLRLERGSVLVLDKRVDDPVELYVGDRLIARGELEECEGDTSGQLAVRLTEVADFLARTNRDCTSNKFRVPYRIAPFVNWCCAREHFAIDRLHDNELFG